jgi:probable HAF family extracellular repeat protein
VQTIRGAKAGNFLVAVAALSASLGFATPVFAITFTAAILNPDGKLTYLGTLGGANTRPGAINDAGQVVGASDTAGNPERAFITGPNGVGMTNLGTLGGTFSSATGINNAGQVVGFSGTADGSQHAFITGPNGIGMRELGALNGANAINDAGEVVGYSDTTGYRQLFVTGPNGVGMTALGVEPGWSDAEVKGINDAGQVVGNNGGAAFMTGPSGVGVTLLGRGYQEFVASGINDAGQITGYSLQWVGDYFHEVPFITGPNGVGVTFLDTLGGNDSYASGMNDAGQVTGYFYMDGGGYSHGFITGANGVGMTDLNSLVNLPDGNFIDRAYAINNRGQILVTVAAVPEPETYALLLAGLALVSFMRRLRKAAWPLPFSRNVQLRNLSG